MLYIDSKNTDPYFNLATEEFLLKYKEEDFFMLWVSNPCVIVGKHQNTLAEINYNFVRKNGIDVARRLSGGGTVYHDTGNLNFTWIMTGETGKLVDFKKFINPIIHFLKTYEINAIYGGRNDILVNNKKISGNAEHIFKNRTLHHGTLLFETDLFKLRNSLQTDHLKYTDKAVKSIPHRVVNIKELIDKNENFKLFRSKLFDYIKDIKGVNTTYELTTTELKQIESLKNEKYKQWDWIFGYSPDYTFNRKVKINNDEIIIGFKVHKGIISNVICKNLKNSELRRIIKNTLEYNLHKEDIIRENFNVKLKELANHFNPDIFTLKLF